MLAALVLALLAAGVAQAGSVCYVDGGADIIPLTTPLDSVTLNVSLVCNGTLAGPTGPIAYDIPDPTGEQVTKVSLNQVTGPSGATIGTFTFGCYAETSEKDVAVDVILKDSAGKSYPTQYVLRIKLDDTYWPRTKFVAPTPTSIAETENEAPIFVASHDAKATGTVSVANPFHDPRYGVSVSVGWMRVFNTGTREIHTIENPTPSSPHWPAGLELMAGKPVEGEVDASFSWSYAYTTAETVGTLVTLGIDLTDNLHTYPRRYLAARMYEEPPKQEPCTIEEKGNAEVTLKLGETTTFSMTATCPPGTSIVSKSYPASVTNLRVVGSIAADATSLTGEFGVYADAGSGTPVVLEFSMEDTTGAKFTRTLSAQLGPLGDLPPRYQYKWDTDAETNFAPKSGVRDVDVHIIGGSDDIQRKASISLGGSVMRGNGNTKKSFDNVPLQGMSVTKSYKGTAQGTDPTKFDDIVYGVNVDLMDWQSLGAEGGSFTLCPVVTEAYYAYQPDCRDFLYNGGGGANPSGSPSSSGSGSGNGGGNGGKKARGTPGWAIGLIVSAVVLAALAVVAVVAVRRSAGSRRTKNGPMAGEYDTEYAALDN